jgi:hypothetical protein
VDQQKNLTAFYDVVLQRLKGLPSVSVSTTIAAKPGEPRSWRNAHRKSHQRPSKAHPELPTFRSKGLSESSLI